VAADLRHALSLAVPAGRRKRDRLGHDMACAGLQWLQEIGLQAALHAESIVTVQVNFAAMKQFLSEQWARH